MSQTNPKLRFGLWYAFRNPPQWRRSYQDIYNDILEMNEHLELFAAKVMPHFR